MFFYSNTVYVKPICSKFFYREYMEENTSKKGSICSDIHYDEREYLKLFIRFNQSISTNYSLLDTRMEQRGKSYQKTNRWMEKF